VERQRGKTCAFRFKPTPLVFVQESNKEQQTGSGAHSASYPTGTGSLSPGVKAAGT